MEPAVKFPNPYHTLWSDFWSAEHLSSPAAFCGTCWVFAASDSSATWVNAKIPAPALYLQSIPVAMKNLELVSDLVLYAHFIDPVPYYLCISLV